MNIRPVNGVGFSGARPADHHPEASRERGDTRFAPVVGGVDYIDPEELAVAKAAKEQAAKMVAKAVRRSRK